MDNFDKKFNKIKFNNRFSFIAFDLNDFVDEIIEKIDSNVENQEIEQKISYDGRNYTGTLRSFYSFDNGVNIEVMTTYKGLEDEVNVKFIINDRHNKERAITAEVSADSYKGELRSITEIIKNQDLT